MSTPSSVRSPLDVVSSGSGPGPDVFSRRRDRVAKRVGADGLLVVPAGVEAPRNHDVDHEFRQASQFWWLTGFGEPDAVAVLTPGHADGDYHLFVRPRDPERETWDGYRAGVKGAKDTFGADRAYPIAELGNRLPALAVGRDRVWYRLGERLDETVTALLVGGRNRRDRLGDRVPDGVIDSASCSTSSALNTRRRPRLATAPEPWQPRGTVRRCAWPGPGNRATARGDGGWARPGPPTATSIVAGTNACVLHYTENADVAIYIGADRRRLRGGPALGRHHLHLPVNGRFSGPQRAMYEVAAAQHRRWRPRPGANSPPHEARAVIAEARRSRLILRHDDAGTLDAESLRTAPAYWLGPDVTTSAPTATTTTTAVAETMALMTSPASTAPTKGEVTLLLARPHAWALPGELGVERAKAAEEAELAERHLRWSIGFPRSFSASAFASRTTSS
jgi:Xaa-Pro aminopeptidase